MGFFAAVALEWGTQESTFKLFAPEQTALLAAAVVASIAIAAALAASAAYPRAQAASAARASGSDGDGAEGGVQAQARAWWWLGARIHEAVMSSLTGNQGSASGITQLRVDEVRARAWQKEVAPPPRHLSKPLLFEPIRILTQLRNQLHNSTHYRYSPDTAVSRRMTGPSPLPCACALVLRHALTRFLALEPLALRGSLALTPCPQSHVLDPLLSRFHRPRLSISLWTGA